MSEQSDEALVEEVSAQLDPSTMKRLNDWIAAREAAAEAKGKREGIEEAAKVAEASPFNNGLNDAPSAIATAIRARLGKKP